ncbi:MAG: ATP-binding protein [Candidatus Electryoneaceae bacterium]|nr:ATP-binding protein [Candidatus Electryoneaceae bacterium]
MKKRTFHLSLSWKFGFLLTSFVVVITMIIILNFRISYRAATWIGRVTESIFPQFSESVHMSAAFERIIGLLEDAAITGEGTLLIRSDREKVMFLDHLNVLHDNMFEGQESIDELREKFEDYYRQAYQAATLSIALMTEDEDSDSLIDVNILEEYSLTALLLKQQLQVDFRQLVTDRERWTRQSLTRTMQGLDKQLKRTLWIGIIASIFLLMVFIFLARRILTSIGTLSDMTMHIAQGNLDQSVDESLFARDEIGQLAASFNVMTRGLEETTVSRDYVDNIIRSMPDSLIVLKPDRTIETVNQGTVELLEYEESELIGRPMRVICVGNICRSLTPEHLLKNGFVRNIEGTYRAKDGRLIPVDFSSALIRDVRGNVQGIVCMAKDITERVWIEETLRKAKDAAEAVSRSKSEFLARMSHELRTPLNSVIGFTNVLLKNKGGHFPEKSILYLQRILVNGKHLLSLINDLLDLSKVESGRMELVIGPVALDELIRNTITQLEGQVRGKDVELLDDIPLDIRQIETDEARLKQVLINLIGNSIKFTKKGSVTTRVRVDPLNRRPISIDVIDTGIGIQEDRFEAIFETFQQADNTMARKYEGSGLGLAISRSLCRLMKYDLQVTSELNKGSMFSIILQSDSEKHA